MALRTVIGDTLCKRDGEVLHVTTPSAQRASAVALPPHRGATVLANGLAVNLRVLVHGGEIGIGLMAADGEYRHEVRVGAREDAKRVDIPLPAGTTLGSLLVRNTCADSASRADIELIGFEDAPDREQPYWTALRTVASGAV